MTRRTRGEIDAAYGGMAGGGKSELARGTVEAIFFRADGSLACAMPALPVTWPVAGRYLEVPLRLGRNTSVNFGPPSAGRSPITMFRAMLGGVMRVVDTWPNVRVSWRDGRPHYTCCVRIEQAEAWGWDPRGEGGAVEKAWSHDSVYVTLNNPLVFWERA
jgi:hypothetical protein